jgi:integrase
MAAASGMRRGELLGLRWRDVDFEAGRVNVRRQYRRQDSQLKFCEPKSAKSLRSIDLDPETWSARTVSRQ